LEIGETQNKQYQTSQILSNQVAENHYSTSIISGGQSNQGSSVLFFEAVVASKNIVIPYF
jgi:hypothetical protein